MAKLIRKISVGKDYKNDAMHYAVGQEVYGGHIICDILEEDDKYSKNWKIVQPYSVLFMQYFIEKIGPYPYKQYSVILAGDGGMEYAMCTFIGGFVILRVLLGLSLTRLLTLGFSFYLPQTSLSTLGWTRVLLVI